MKCTLTQLITLYRWWKNIYLLNFRSVTNSCATVMFHSAKVAESDFKGNLNAIWQTWLAAQKPWFHPYRTPFDELEQQVPARFHRRASVTNHRHGNKSLQPGIFTVSTLYHLSTYFWPCSVCRYIHIFNSGTYVFTFGSLIIRRLQPDSSQRSKVRLVHNARKKAFYVWGATGFHLLWVFGEYWHIYSCMCVFHCASLSLRELSLRLKCVFSHRARQAPCCSWLKQPL